MSQDTTSHPTEIPAPDARVTHVRITVTCDAGHVIGTWLDTIEEKYPFWCDECDDDKRTGKYPWKLTTEVVQDGPAPVCPATHPVTGYQCTRVVPPHTGYAHIAGDGSQWEQEAGR
jgi:hypothetical protein